MAAVAVVDPEGPVDATGPVLDPTDLVPTASLAWAAVQLRLALALW